MKLDDIPQDIEPRVGDILEIEQGDVCFEVRIIGITADGYLCEQDNIQGAVLLEGVDLDHSDVTDITGYIAEEKVRLDPKCWKGKKIGNPKTKMKGGVRVNNCVPEGKEIEEAGPFRSTEPKKPRKGSVADLAAKKRKEQERGKPPIEPRDQMVGVAKVIKDVSEGSDLPPKVIEMIKKIAQSSASPEHKKAAIDALVAKYSKKGVAEGPGKLQGTPVVSLSDFSDKDDKKDKYGRTVPKKLKKDDPRVKFHKDEKKGVAEGLDPIKKKRLNALIDLYREANDPNEYANDQAVYKDDVIARIRLEFGDKIADRVEKSATEGVAEGSDDIRKKISKFEELALQANKAGDDAKSKMYQQKIQSLKQKMSQGIQEGSDNTVSFEVDSENAYNRIMKKFRSVIDWDGDTMVAPRKYWDAIQELAYQAGGEATEVGYEQGVNESTEQSLQKKIQSRRDALGLAREQRRARGQHQQGQREIKLQAEIDNLNDQLRELKKQGVKEGRYFRTAYGYAGGYNEKTGGKYKHPEDIRADREAKKKTKDQEQAEKKPHPDTLKKQGVQEGYTGRETKDGTWRVFKDGKAVAVAGPFKSREEAAAWRTKARCGGRLGDNRQWSNKDNEQFRRAVKDIEDNFGPNDAWTKTKQRQIKQRIKTEPMSGPKGKLPEQGVQEGAEEHEYSLSMGNRQRPDSDRLDTDSRSRMDSLRAQEHDLKQRTINILLKRHPNWERSDLELAPLPELIDMLRKPANEDMDEAKYQGREVPLGKKMAGDVAKSKVYVRKPNGKVVKVNFGDKNMTIKKSNPKRRKSFRARHNCDNPGPKWKARYWSCRSW